MSRTLRKVGRGIGIIVGLMSGAILIIFGILAAYQLLGGWGILMGLGAFPLLAMGGSIVLVWISIGGFPWTLLILQIMSFAGFGLYSLLEED